MFFPFVAVILHDIVQADAAVLDSFDANFVQKSEPRLALFFSC
jgi:hypothetical protein